jgi:hypothetical protein
MTGVCYKNTARALADRRLVKISTTGGQWHVALTEAGQYYLEHGTHPLAADPLSEIFPVAGYQGRPAHGRSKSRNPRRPGWGRATLARRRKRAAELVAQLVEQSRVSVPHASDEEIKAWRDLVTVAKREGVIPDGHRIKTTKMHDGRLELRLLEGLHPNDRRHRPTLELDPVSVPQRLRRPHPVVAQIRDDPGLLVLPGQAQLRTRALRILQALVTEAEHRGHQVVPRPVDQQHHRIHWRQGQRPELGYERGEAQLRVEINGFGYVVDIRRENPQATDPDRVERLRLTLPGRTVHRSRWADRKTSVLEDYLAHVLYELEQRAVADRDAAEKADRARLERRVRWEAAMRTAREQAIEAHYRDVLMSQLERWKLSQQLDAYAEALARRIESAPEAETVEARSAHEWSEWVRAYADDCNPLKLIPIMPSIPKIEDRDLAPFLKGWSPYGPDGDSIARRH